MTKTKKELFCLISIIFFVTIIVVYGNSKSDVLKGKWKASVEDQIIHQFYDGSIRGGEEDYILECDGRGKYDLRDSSGDLANSGYTVSKNVVTFYDEGGKILAICKLVNNNELDCSQKSYYSIKYVRVD